MYYGSKTTSLFVASCVTYCASSKDTIFMIIINAHLNETNNYNYIDELKLL